MAASDYHICVRCCAKVFYDRDLWDTNDWYTRAHDEERIIVLCEDCFKTHEIVVRRRQENGSDA